MWVYVLAWTKIFKRPELYSSCSLFYLHWDKWSRHIGFLQVQYFFFREFYVQRCHSIFQLFFAAKSKNRCCNKGLGEHPCKGNLVTISAWVYCVIQDIPLLLTRAGVSPFFCAISSRRSTITSVFFWALFLKNTPVALSVPSLVVFLFFPAKRPRAKGDQLYVQRSVY